MNDALVFALGMLVGATALRWWQIRNSSVSIRKFHGLVASAEYAKDGLRQILDVATTIEAAHKLAGRTLDKVARYE